MLPEIFQTPIGAFCKTLGRAYFDMYCVFSVHCAFKTVCSVACIYCDKGKLLVYSTMFFVGKKMFHCIELQTAVKFTAIKSTARLFLTSVQYCLANSESVSVLLLIVGKSVAVHN